MKKSATQTEHSAADGKPDVAAQPRRPGRPRDPQKDELILETALAELMAQGFQGMSIDKVSERSGIGKPAIYLRYKDKESLTIAVLGRLASQEEPHHSGDAAADLRAEITVASETLERVGSVPLLGTLLAESKRHPELLAMYQDRLVQPRVAKLAAILRRAQRKGDVADDEATLATATHLLVGFILGSYIIGRPLTPKVISDAVNLVLRGLR